MSGNETDTWRERRAAVLAGPGGQLVAFPTEENELAVYVQETPTEQVWVRTGHCWRVHVHCPLPARLAREMAYSLREQADMADAATEPWQGDARRFAVGTHGLSDMNRVVVYGQSSGTSTEGGVPPRVVVEVIDEHMKDPAERVTYAHMDTDTARRCADALDAAADAADALAVLHAPRAGGRERGLPPPRRPRHPARPGPPGAPVPAHRRTHGPQPHP